MNQLRQKALQMKQLAEDILDMLDTTPVDTPTASDKVIAEVKHYIQAANTDPKNYTPLDLDWVIEKKLFKQVQNSIYFVWRNLGVPGVVNGTDALKLIGAEPKDGERNPRVSMPFDPVLFARITGLKGTAIPHQAHQAAKTEWATF